eukprot:m.14342 g.14342  ORF g.14342 m.14342 type:complete len:413 (+) comp25703_c0_seq1:21-1259(+)
MLLLLLFSFLLNIDLSVEETRMLGMHRPSEGHVESLSTIPSSSDFYAQFVGPKRPVLLKRALPAAAGARLWTDDYLRSNVGDVIVDLETAKKEDRKKFGFQSTLRKFIENYRKKNIYMVGSLPVPLRAEWPIPECLSCGGFTDNTADARIWFSSGGTTSVLHVDQYENLHCVVFGSKKFVLMDRRFMDVIENHNGDRGYYEMDVDSIDLDEYPSLKEIPWFEADVNERDCLYIPYLWLHQVRSKAGTEGKNLAVNTWWARFKFNESDCRNNHQVKKTLSDVTFKPSLTMRDFLLDISSNGTLDIDSFTAAIQERIAISDEGATKVFRELLDGKRSVTTEELEGFEYERWVRANEVLYEVGGDKGEYNDDEGNLQETEESMLPPELQDMAVYPDEEEENINHHDNKAVEKTEL